MNNDLLKIILKHQAEIWLKENPLMLNSQEKQKFLVGLQEYIENKNVAIDDEVYDFLVQRKLIQSEPREDIFLRYLIKKYGKLENVNILDVGAGRVCSLSRAIANKGANVTAMDTNIRISNQHLKKAKIITIKKLFCCDEFSKNGVGTDIAKFNIIVGLEPCDATEHIIRQSLKYNKPFEINLCAAPHKGLNGETFRTYKQWYDYLLKISKEILIIENDCGFIATNNEEYLEM